MLQIKPYIIGCTQPSILQKDRMNEIKSNRKLECSFPYRMINKATITQIHIRKELVHILRDTHHRVLAGKAVMAV